MSKSSGADKYASRITTNAIWLWMSQLAQVVSGFILPRLMNDQLGQQALGIWDLGWTFLHLMSLLAFGVGTAGNRFISMLHESGQEEQLDRTISSILIFQFAMGVFGMLLMMVVSSFTYIFNGVEEAGLADEATVVFVCLGLSVFLRLASQVFDGVVSSVGRWDIIAMFRATSYLGYAAVAVIALLAGEGLKTLAVLYLAAEFFLSAGKVVAAYRVFDMSRKRLLSFHFETLKEVLAFSGKNFIDQFSGVIYRQSALIFVGTTVGAGAVALYARPANLLTTVRSALLKVGQVSTPVLSRYLAKDDHEGIQSVVARNLSTTFPLAFGGAVLFATLGPDVLQVWMGADYARRDLCMLLSVSFGVVAAQHPLYTLLVALNQHGRIAIVRMSLALASLAALWLLIRSGYPPLTTAAFM